MTWKTIVIEKNVDGKLSYLIQRYEQCSHKYKTKSVTVTSVRLFTKLYWKHVL